MEDLGLAINPFYAEFACSANVWWISFQVLLFHTTVQNHTRLSQLEALNCP